MAQLTGRERASQIITGMERERAALVDPNVRAERFVQRWQDLAEQRQALRGWQHNDARQKVEGQMRGMAESLGRDAQVESILRNVARTSGSIGTCARARASLTSCTRA
ncbi:hypothetical protein BRCH_03409c [Candidatus Burkholderia brachyanthoides]|nr:hypothetical protein BRCH_03409c [Candidatus Burkholderia brachyanthoides]